MGIDYWNDAMLDRKRWSQIVFTAKTNEAFIVKRDKLSISSYILIYPDDKELAF